MSDIEIIEMHDARISNVSIDMSGSVRIAFSHIAVYLRETPETCGVWSFTASLVATGVRKAHLECALPVIAEDSVNDGVLMDADGNEFDVVRLLDGGDNLQLDITWCLPPNRFTCHAKTMKLELEKKQERIETWNDLSADAIANGAFRASH